jgi:uncharacterized repeat protein (TIGR01451 family)
MQFTSFFRNYWRTPRLWLHLLALASTLAGSMALAQVCASPGLNAATTSISGVINSYYPGTGASVGIGSTSIPIGTIDTAGGGTSTAIAAGDLLIVMQMQGAEINSSNSDCYGDGAGGCTTITFTTGAQYAGGNLATNYLAGAWEYCTATSGAPAASISVICGGATGGTVNAYRASAATGIVGAYRYQVVRVPQYASVTVTAVVQPASWNGNTGGVLGLQATDTVTMASNLDASERGFRGGGVTFLAPYGTSLLDPVNGSFFYTAPTGTITGAGPGGEREGSFKGEGIAGTPRLVYNGVTQTGLVTDDYPGGSRSRGAPGNAGGGGNNQNGGGGGGGNGGLGGQGGGCWNDVSRPINIGDCGGHGGDGASRAGNNLNLSSARLIMGGGGGAGHVDGGGTSCELGGWGGNGGGIIIARVGNFSGAGNLLANGRAGFVPNFTAGGCTDAAGGGGAGGSILVATNGSLAGRTFAANGGNGGNSSYDRHGPGGGGGGGAVYFNASGAPTFSVGGGNAGVDRGNLAAGSLGDGVAEPWFAGTGTFTVLGNSTPLSLACSTALSVTKTNNTTTLVAGTTTSYTITFSNAGPTSANNAIAQDTPSAGLSNCSVTACSASGSPVAVCPASGVWPNLFTVGGLTLTSMPANSSLTFNVSCGVTATGQ